MDSASPIAPSRAGQTSADSDTLLSFFAMATAFKRSRTLPPIEWRENVDCGHYCGSDRLPAAGYGHAG